MKKRYAVLSAFVLMFSFSFVSAQTLDQYKSSTPAPATMNQLVASSSLRASLSLSDLKLVYSYCVNNVLAGAKHAIAFAIDEGESPAAAQAAVDSATKNCAAIQAEINSRPVPSTPAPTPAGVILPQKASPDSYVQQTGPGTYTKITPPAVVTDQVSSTTDIVQVPSAELTDLAKQIEDTKTILGWFMGLSVVFFGLIAWKLGKR